MENYSLSDLATITNGGSNSSWLIILFILIFGWGGRGFGTNADSATNEILSGQKFDALSRQINQVGDGLASSTYALNNAITTEGRAIQSQLSQCCCENQKNVDSLRYDMSQGFAGIQKQMSEDKIASLQSQLSTVQNQLALQTAMCGVPKINPNLYGVYPYANGGCGCNTQ